MSEAAVYFDSTLLVRLLEEYYIGWHQGSKLTFLLGSTGVPNFKKLGAPQMF